MAFGPENLTQDKFLNGRLTLLQPRNGYRAGIDAVLLAAAVEARPAQSVLELGCGAGAAALCLASRVGGLSITGIERQPEYADLARRNAQANQIQLDVLTGDLADLPPALKAASYDHVMMNPPYYQPQRATASDDPGRAGALFEDTPIATWADIATRRLKPGGSLTVILKAERLPDLLTALDHRLGSVIVRPMAPRPGRDAALVLVRALKGGRASFRLTAPLVLHEGAAHPGDREHYRPEILKILRGGAGLSIG